MSKEARCSKRRAVRTPARTQFGTRARRLAGVALTAMPGGVWASFRTGMLGLTIHLGQHDLAMITPPGPGVAQRPANGLFQWPMSATTVYGGGALWLVNEAGSSPASIPKPAQSGLASAFRPRGRLCGRRACLDPVPHDPTCASSARSGIGKSPLMLDPALRDVRHHVEESTREHRREEAPVRGVRRVRRARADLGRRRQGRRRRETGTGPAPSSGRCCLEQPSPCW